jgi:hypothetical protein
MNIAGLVSFMIRARPLSAVRDKGELVSAQIGFKAKFMII